MSEEDNPDQSMEEILQSIKRIIADDEEPESADDNDSVLELTDIVEDEAAPQPEPQAEPEPEAIQAEPEANSEMVEILPEEPEEKVQAEPEPEPEPSPQPAPASAADDDDEPLVSDAAALASANAMNSLRPEPEAPPPPPAKIDSPAFSSGKTVEDIVAESLKPMLKEWLDANLQTVVERIVEKEVKRISGK